MFIFGNLICLSQIFNKKQKCFEEVTNPWSMQQTLICLTQPMTVVSNTCSTELRLLTLPAASANTSMDGNGKWISPWKIQKCFINNCLLLTRRKVGFMKTWCVLEIVVAYHKSMYNHNYVISAVSLKTRKKT